MRRAPKTAGEWPGQDDQVQRVLLADVCHQLAVGDLPQDPDGKRTWIIQTLRMLGYESAGSASHELRLVSKLCLSLARELEGVERRAR